MKEKCIFKLMLLTFFICRAFTRNVTREEHQNGTISKLMDCPADWLNAYDLGCYKLLTNHSNLSWVGAQNQCEVEGGYLIEPNTIEKATHLYSLAALLLPFTNIRSWFLGLTDLGREGSWIWIHSAVVADKTFWDDEAPLSIPGNDLDCAVMVLNEQSFSWEGVSCTSTSSQSYPICQRGISDIANNDDTKTGYKSSADCPAGYTHFGRNCYRFHWLSKSWYEADAYCLTQGGHLPSVHSYQEEKFLQKLSGENIYWLGAYPKSSSAAGWVWSDGTEWDYDKYISNGRSSTECLYMDDTAYWRKNYCSNSYPSVNVICKI